MKKTIILGIVFLLVGCQSTGQDNIEVLNSQITDLEQQVSVLTDNKTMLMDQIKTVSEEKILFDNENVMLREQLTACENEKVALVVENDAVQKNLESMTINSYEAQYNFDVRIVQNFNGEIKYVFEPAEIPHAQYYTVIGVGPNLENVHEEDHETITLGENEYEVTSFRVEGTIYNFKWSNITWDDTYTTYTISEVIESIDEITDLRVNIHAMLPEGLPGQVVTWENSDGELFSITLSYDGYGFEGSIILSE